MHRAVSQAQELGHLNLKAAPEQILFEIHGLILALHYEARFLKSPGSIERALRAFDSVLHRYGGAPPSQGRDAPAKVARLKPLG